MSEENNNILDGLLRVGLVLGSIWLGSEIIKDLSKEDKGKD